MAAEMAAAVSKVMRHQDLILVARKCRVQTRFRGTLGLPGRLSTRLQPNHPTDDLAGIAASVQRAYASAIAGEIPPDQALPELWLADDDQFDARLGG